jgi:PIN domain nuclease of toxin-antitoxin system
LTPSSTGAIDVRLLLDTVAFIHAAASPEDLGRRVEVALRNPKTILELSTISLTEIAIKSALGKLRFSAEDARMAVEQFGIRTLPYNSEHAFYLFELPLHHRDPFDRQIIAQALTEKISIATPDEKFRLYEGLKVIW